MIKQVQLGSEEEEHQETGEAGNNTDTWVTPWQKNPYKTLKQKIILVDPIHAGAEGMTVEGHYWACSVGPKP